MSILTEELEERYPIEQGDITPLIDRTQLALMQQANYKAGAKRARTRRELDAMADRLLQYTGPRWSHASAANIVRNILDAGDRARDENPARRPTGEHGRA